MNHRHRAGIASLLLAGALSTSAGCGTLTDTCGDDRRRSSRDESLLTRVRGGRVRIYGGIRYDIEILGEARAGWMLVLYAFDLPLSLVVDTVLLPFTIPYNLAK